MITVKEYRGHIRNWEELVKDWELICLFQEKSGKKKF